MTRFVGDVFDGEKRSQVEKIQWEIAARALELGTNVILNFVFGSRAERDGARTRGSTLGADVKIHYLDVPMEELLRRMTVRNAEESNSSFHIREENLRLWATSLEKPMEDELI